jgi:hypothetical protein
MTKGAYHNKYQKEKKLDIVRLNKEHKYCTFFFINSFLTGIWANKEAILFV